ncbi:MAG: DUF4240 domain-containing protein [Chitinophagales bacterium]|nr:DUF4240 domain-containing protein [Chitinophagales bacterium]
MSNIIRYPLRNISPETISDLQEKYPNASVRIELSDDPREDGLSEAAFWDLIAKLDWSKPNDDEAIIEPLVEALSKSPLRHIYDFKDILAQKLYLLDTAAHAAHIGEHAYSPENDFFSEDGFLFARCCAVANGQQFYEKARVSPEFMPKNLEFPALLRVANEAHRRARGILLRYVSTYSIETFSNKNGWAAAQLPE